MKRAVLYVVISLIFLLCSFACVDFDSSYGVVQLKFPEGQEIYFKRESRGLDYDVLVISPNNDLCKMPDSQLDFRFPSNGGGKRYYKIDGNTLVLFVWTSAIPPSSGQFPVDVIQHELNPIEYREMEKNAEKMGLKYIEVPFDNNLKCRRGWFD